MHWLSDKGVGILITGLALFTAALVLLAEHKTFIKKTECETNGGHYFQSRGGNVCLDKDAVVQPNKRAGD